MSSFSLPGISRIEIVLCDDLPSRVMEHSMCGCIVALAVPSVRIGFSGSPSLTCEGTIVSGQRQEKSTLEFSTLHRLPEGKLLAFVVSCVNGSQYLIGSREGRFPVINYTDTSGEPGRSAAVRTYKITHIALKSMLPCVL